MRYGLVTDLRAFTLEEQMIRDKLEEALMRCSAWERDACIALAQDDQESARAVLSNIIDFATLKL